MMLIKDNVVPYSTLASRRRPYHVIKIGKLYHVVEKGTKRTISSWQDRETAYKQCRVLISLNVI